MGRVGDRWSAVSHESVGCGMSSVAGLLWLMTSLASRDVNDRHCDERSKTLLIWSSRDRPDSEWDCRIRCLFQYDFSIECSCEELRHRGSGGAVWASVSFSSYTIVHYYSTVVATINTLFFQQHMWAILDRNARPSHWAYRFLHMPMSKTSKPRSCRSDVRALWKNR
jgi:hypothetical protein